MFTSAIGLVIKKCLGNVKFLTISNTLTFFVISDLYWYQKKDGNFLSAPPNSCSYFITNPQECKFEGTSWFAAYKSWMCLCVCQKQTNHALCRLD